ncbi:monofunctional pimaradiene synthase-like [Phalaenopsis equestris]|uniref:monofunctional pimaradiene synthase-like n=1 Tax=Phalaenopsis equestris TaxID=78828 RepID=UPI0009E1DFFD|nr:monofunctional pimaradiene synthase-like [Phalaenopsis equestris]
MRSFTNNMLLSKPSIPSYSLSNLQLRSLNSCNFRLPAAVNAYFYRTRPQGVGALKVIQGEALEEKTKDLSPLQLNTYDLDEDEQEERIEILVKEIKELFSSIGDGEVSPSAYDTAWVARIPSMDDPNKPQFPTTLEWVMKNQLEDGSWGEPIFFSIYDRLVCTLSCVITLTQWKQGHELIAKGKVSIFLNNLDSTNDEDEYDVFVTIYVLTPILVYCICIRASFFTNIY